MRSDALGASLGACCPNGMERGVRPSSAAATPESRWMTETSRPCRIPKLAAVEGDRTPVGGIKDALNSAGLCCNPARGGLFIELVTSNISLLFFAPPIPATRSEISARIAGMGGAKNKRAGAQGTVCAINRPPLAGFGSCPRQAARPTYIRFGQHALKMHSSAFSAVSPPPARPDSP